MARKSKNPDVNGRVENVKTHTPITSLDQIWGLNQPQHPSDTEMEQKLSKMDLIDIQKLGLDTYGLKPTQDRKRAVASILRENAKARSTKRGLGIAQGSKNMSKSDKDLALQLLSRSR